MAMTAEHKGKTPDINYIYATILPFGSNVKTHPPPPDPVSLDVNP